MPQKLLTVYSQNSKALSRVQMHAPVPQAHEADEAAEPDEAVEPVEVASAASGSASETDSDVLVEVEQLLEKHEASLQSSTTSAPQSSSSSSSSDDDGAPGEIVAGVAAASSDAREHEHSQLPQREAEREAGEGSAGLLRAIRPETFEWGENSRFRLTFRPPNGFQALCRIHSASAESSTRCTKACTFVASDPDSRLRALKKLKSWCLVAPNYRTRLEHQGGRGLSEEHLLFQTESDAALDKLEHNLRVRS